MNKVMREIITAANKTDWPDVLDELEKALLRGVGVIREVKADPAKQLANDNFKQALGSGNFQLAVEYLERGFTPEANSPLHFRAYLKALAEPETGMIGALEKHDCGVPQDPLLALDFLQQTTEKIKSDWTQGCLEFAKVLQKHCKPGESTIARFTERMLNTGRMDVVDVLGLEHLPEEKRVYKGKGNRSEVAFLPDNETIAKLVEKGIKVEDPDIVVNTIRSAVFDVYDAKSAGVALERIKAAMSISLKDGKPLESVVYGHNSFMRSPHKLHCFSDDQLKDLVDLGLFAEYENNSILRCYVEKNDHQMLDRLLSIGGDVNEKLSNGKTTLAHILALTNRDRVEADKVGSDVKTLAVLVKHNIDLSVRDFGDKPAHQHLHSSRTKLREAFKAAEARQEVDAQATAPKRAAAPR